MDNIVANFIGRTFGMNKFSAAFMSYARFDDEHNSGQLTKFRKLLSGEVRALTGMQFDIFQDTSDIALGQKWKGRISAGIDECDLFMPIITPSFFTSPSCRYELERFMRRESKLGRNNLIPLYYITCPNLKDNPSPDVNRLVKAISERNYFDLRDVRGRLTNGYAFRAKLTELAMQVVESVERNRAKRGHGALTSSAHGTVGLAQVAGACAPANSGIPARTDPGQSADDQAAADLLDCWTRMRHYFDAVECMQKDV